MYYISLIPWPHSWSFSVTYWGQGYSIYSVPQTIHYLSILAQRLLINNNLRVTVGNHWDHMGLLGEADSKPLLPQQETELLEKLRDYMYMHMMTTLTDNLFSRQQSSVG